MFISIIVSSNPICDAITFCLPQLTSKTITTRVFVITRAPCSHAAYVARTIILIYIYTTRFCRGTKYSNWSRYRAGKNPKTFEPRGKKNTRNFARRSYRILVFIENLIKHWNVSSASRILLQLSALFYKLSSIDISYVPSINNENTRNADKRTP